MSVTEKEKINILKTLKKLTEQIELITPFQTKKIVTSKEHLYDRIFIYERNKKNSDYFLGQGILWKSGNKFLILKDSKTSTSNYNVSPYSKHNSQLQFQTICKKLEKNGIIKIRKNMYVFQKNHSFSSPSAASGFLKCGSSNGWTAWRCKKTNQTLDSVYRMKFISKLNH